MSLAFTRNPGIPLKLRRRIGKIFHRDIGSRDFEITVLGARYAGRTDNIMDKKIYLYGCHETSTIRLIQTILKRQRSDDQSPVYLDIGTNTGLHLVTAAPFADKAYGFEPYAPVREKALANIGRNQFDNVRVFPFGLSNADAELPYTPPCSGNLGNGYFQASEQSPVNDDTTITLSVRKGDDVMRDNNIAPTLMKIDVEGFEKFVLEGLQDTISSHRPDIIFEYNAETRRHDSDVIEDIKAVLGDHYSLYGICRSRELPKLVTFNQSKAFENVLATTMQPPI